jgi:LPXTG-motif cell wall-anchored protein
MRSIRSVLHSLKPQKRVLIIGSTFVDMVINVQEMPRAGADVEGDYRCTACGGTVKGETGDFRHSGPLELRDVRTATCTERGYSGNQYCTSCDRIAQKGVSTPSLHEIADNYKLINEVKPGCTTSGYSGDQQCTAGCGQIIRYGHVVNKLSHDWDGGKPAKQGKSEGILYTCQRADCGETRFVRSPAATEFTVTVIKGTASVAAGTPITDKIAQNTVVTVTADAPEAGKVFDKWVVLEGNVTLADATKATTTFTMPGNDVKLEATYKDAPPSHTHSYGTEWKYDDTDHWHECECGDKANIAAHSASEWIVDTAATETADGAKHKECTVCKKVLETAPIPATGSNHTHSYGTEWKYDGTNHWHECECGDKADTAAHSFQWVIDKAATKEATGIKHEKCTVCGAKRSENTVIDKLPDGGNTDNTGSSDNNTNKPGNDDSTKCPQTGDSSNHIGWLAALCGVLTLLGVSGKKRKKSEVE